jgi:hypothetical protein
MLRVQKTLIQFFTLPEQLSGILSLELVGLAQASLGYLLQLFNLQKGKNTYFGVVKRTFSGIAAYGFKNHLRAVRGAS